jgi:cellulase/cellobiase CelA1
MPNVSNPARELAMPYRIFPLSVFTALAALAIVVVASPMLAVAQATTQHQASRSSSMASCRATYMVVGQWEGGFTAEVIVTNTGPIPISGWTVTITFPDGQHVTQSWNASFTQSGAVVIVKSPSENGFLTPGSSASFGFNGTWTGANGTPTVTCWPQ